MNIHEQVYHVRVKARLSKGKKKKHENGWNAHVWSNKPQKCEIIIILYVLMYIYMYISTSIFYVLTDINMFIKTRMSPLMGKKCFHCLIIGINKKKCSV